MSFTRTEFGCMAAAGMLSRLAPAAKTQEEGRVIGHGIVGLGRISMQHFMPAVKMSKRARVTALVSGHRDTGEKIAAEHGVPGTSIYSADYERIADNKNVDVVYIGLPNGMHAEHTIRAAKAGKHVLCEKPMATTVADCRTMIEAWRSAGMKLMIAYRRQYEPTNLRAIQLIRDGWGRYKRSRAPTGLTFSRRNGGSIGSWPAAVP